MTTVGNQGAKAASLCQRKGYKAPKCNAESQRCRFVERNEEEFEDGEEVEEVIVGRNLDRDSSQAT